MLSEFFVETLALDHNTVKGGQEKAELEKFINVCR
jgi:hypothetical protein